MWQVVRDEHVAAGREVHVLPLDDLIVHEEEGISCDCDPELEICAGKLIVIHNAIDGRE